MYDIVQDAELFLVLPDEDVLEGLLANFALQVLPDVRVNLVCLLAVALALEPFFQAAEADVLHGTCAFTRRD